MFTDQQKRELMYFKRRPTMISGTWMEDEVTLSLSLWTMDRRDTLRAAQKYPSSYGTNTYLPKNWIWQPEKCNSIRTYYLVLPVLTWRTIFRRIWIGKVQNPLKIGSYLCRCSTTLNGHRKAIQKPVCTMPTWQLLQHKSSHCLGVSWSLCWRRRGGTKIPTNPIKCHTSHPVFQRQSHHGLDKWRKKE